MSRALWLVVLVVLGLQALVGCGTSDTEGPKLALGQSCQYDVECPGGFCLPGERRQELAYCTKHCASNADCGSDGSMACGSDATGQRSCLQGCNSTNPNQVCIDGVPTSCKIAPQEQCEKCGCPGALRCQPGMGCVAKSAKGEPCKKDSDCSTDNCSRFAGVCRVPLGAACDGSNCDLCFAATGYSYCSRECAANVECESGLCLGDTGFFYCRPPCTSLSDSSCPAQQCDFTETDQPGRSRYFCRCEHESCVLSSDPRQLGQDCRQYFDCESGQCDDVVTKVDPVYGALRRGMCTKPCATSSECGVGFICAAVGPAECLPACNCVGVPSTEGTTASVCWIKQPNGRSCAEPTDCQSGKCVSNVCTG